MNNIYLFISMLIFFPYSAMAEGNCPPGQFQIGGQGAVACAPIPQEGSIQQPARPAGKWIKTWGAVAMGWVGSIPYYGVPAGKLSKSEAEVDALERCTKKGPKNCAIKLTYFNQCAAIAEPHTSEDLIPDGSKTIFVGNASLEGAANQAEKECNVANRSFQVKCKVIYKACSDQIFKKF
ncbi:MULTISPECIES: DUF4189 domain-containing protein [unclassified Xanthomonas]|uniref:DUF4189 domain-containing protein n=1 Tax=unclassified Xanthomonas TaxID=2643310 RepID=UPI002B22BBA5|nr:MULTISPECIES: DUF4189 domain-containing protein [unclassified Xanthomonas]MEA9563842.1 DUF4189 domain-containing protein [Xanthomonas sp. WHRI 8932A]MEA9634830.1 DUF4189 domain-containing protein [Xanthomonas sp. WHRI 8812E]